ncbi:flagellar hook capping FlgD N-terminal domain-containing protein [Desulfitobacterium metallireducens]|uniref:Flagellar hook capping protein n=1 Tax=Desulfitobacterium metallireducens DSM 15288 TaxID=871968 RepID=W0EFC8_9FIRM|nr:flagellar hook capping FlgD N-terminal domain-containing protein [Desulfitobacterium metallireducens]AHF07766.1 flagellar hook capping protein [Desulfitobacterium metallireducens DSM 15288]
MSTINATNSTPSSGTQNTTQGSQTISNAVNQTLGKDEFLKLLTTELRNQDPLQPMDNKDFIAQMAQFSSLEQMNNVAQSMENLKASMTGYFQQGLLTQGAALIGKQVSGMDTDGVTVISGIVDSVKWLDGNPQLNLLQADGSFKTLEMNQITEVKK